MYKASAGVLLPTSIIGSLPRPAWHTVQLGSRSFLEAMVNARWREQYEDAVSTHLRAQEVAGLDICTDGDAHYDEEIGGWSWQSYPLTHLAGFSREVESVGGRPETPSDLIDNVAGSSSGSAANHSSRRLSARRNARDEFAASARRVIRAIALGTLALRQTQRELA